MSKIDINYPKMNKVIAYLVLGKSVWIALAIGWVVFIVSSIISWEIPASGAVMVCVALIAEIFYENQWWRKISCDPHGCLPLKRDENTGGPIIWSYQIVPAWRGKTGALLSLSTKDEIMDIHDNPDPHWRYKSVLQRVEKIFLLCIITTAVIGTLVWGYAHLLGRGA